MADVPPGLPGGNVPPSGTGSHPSHKQHNGEALSAGVQNIASSESAFTPRLTHSAPHPPATASTASRGATPSLENESSTSNKYPENRDVTMGGGYETRGTFKGNGSSTGNLSGATPQPQATGAPARIYMNEKVVPHLLDGMKIVAKEQPSNPLQVLGEYLLQKSSEVGEPSSAQQNA